MVIRFAKENELERVNELREKIHKLHVKEMPEMFNPDFESGLRDYIYKIFEDPEQEISPDSFDNEDPYCVQLKRLWQWAAWCQLPTG